MTKYRITDVIIYPVKAMAGISLPGANALIAGFEFDRRWMLVDKTGNFLSQRKHPELSIFKVKLLNKTLEISHKNEKITIPFTLKAPEWIPVRIWKNKLNVPVYNNHINEWFSDHLGIHCSLVRMNEKVRRPVSGKYSVKNETVSFADGFPYLIIGKGSLEELNAKLESPVPMNRFRPNLVAEGGRPFEEDRLNFFKIGEAVFKAVKPCARCIVTTVDQESGLRGQEPLTTLSKFRKRGNKILFGQNLICLKEGLVSIRDEINRLNYLNQRHR